jgi:hypothetical protein
MARLENKNINQKYWMIVRVQPKSVIYPRREKRDYFEKLREIPFYEMWNLNKAFHFPFPNPQFWFM